jgi:hypothetical protein
MPPLSEMRVLVRCISPSYDPVCIPSEAASALDWNRLCDLAGLHGIFPIFASRLLSPLWQESKIEIPVEIAAGLKTHWINLLCRSLRLTAALVELQREFDRSGVTVVPWKGVSVGLLLYGSPTLRESGDLDFLFQKKDLQAVLEITRRLGYRLSGSYTSESKYLYTHAMRGEFTFEKKQDRIALEFHLQILPSRFGRWQDAQSDLERASTRLHMAGQDFLMQAPEDILVSLCAHATKHNWDRLKWSCDIAQFLRVYGEKLEWKPFLTRLRRQKKLPVVLLGLSLAANLFELRLPSEAEEALQQNSHVALLTQMVVDHIMSGSTDPMEGSTDPEDIRYERAMIALLCPRLRDRIAYTVQPIFELSSEDLYIPVHNRMLFFMNYFFRFGRLFKKYGPWRLVTKTAVAIRAVR